MSINPVWGVVVLHPITKSAQRPSKWLQTTQNFMTFYVNLISWKASVFLHNYFWFLEGGAVEYNNFNYLYLERLNRR